jgi:hypothetical protein
MKRMLITLALAAGLMLTACGGLGETAINPDASLDWLDCVRVYVEGNYTMEPIADWATIDSTGDALIAACGTPPGMTGQ